MKLKPIINSLLENDLYKFNMGNIIYKRFNDYACGWSFKCRNSDVKFTEDMVNEIKLQVKHFCQLSFQQDELDYLKQTCPWLSQGYINFLKYWKPEENEIDVHAGAGAYNDCGLVIETRGTWLSTSMYEIPILAIVNEVYFSMQHKRKELTEDFKQRTLQKVKDLVTGALELGPFSEFGMRRRLSAETQDWLVKTLAENQKSTKYNGNATFVGTSNVWLARKYNVKPVGTQAHEWFMAFQSKFDLNPAYTNMYGMKVWVEEYETRNGIALTDTLGSDIFLKDFSLTFANLFNGLRHDSGDPIPWGEKMLAHYKKLGVDPKTKTLLFSDSLDFKKAAAIYKHFKDRCNVAFGIGTYLAGVQSKTPLNIVMKMTECNGAPVAKISNTPSKGMCKDPEYVEYLQRCIDWRMKH